MKQAIVHTYVSTRLKFLRYAFICTSKIDMILLRRVVFHTPRRPANVLELSTAKLMFFFQNAIGCFLKKFNQTFFYKLNECLWMDEKNHGKMNNCSKVILMPNK